MELDQLRYFLRVAERGGFTRAAADLSISQPALSRSVAKLEAELGQPLFQREARRVTLTAAGELFRARATQALLLLEDAVAEVADDGETGRVRVGAIPTIAPYLLPDVLRRFSEEHPRASVVVHECTTDALVKSCMQGEVDLAVLGLPIATHGLRTEELFREELFLVLPREHALIDEPTVRLGDIEGYPFVLLDEAHCLSDDIVAFCRRRSFQPVAVERTSQLAMVQELVALSHGISMIPAMARERDHDERRVYRSLSGPKPTRRVAVAWNPLRFQTRLIRSFHVLLREQRHVSSPVPRRRKRTQRQRSRS